MIWNTGTILNDAYGFNEHYPINSDHGKVWKLKDVVNPTNKVQVQKIIGEKLID